MLCERWRLERIVCPRPVVRDGGARPTAIRGDPSALTLPARRRGEGKRLFSARRSAPVQAWQELAGGRTAGSGAGAHQEAQAARLQELAHGQLQVRGGLLVQDQSLELG